jgi:hypothetical protein
LSFAALPHCRSLGESRLVWYWQRRALRPVVFEWLRRATEKTLHQPGADELDGSFGAPLRHLSKLAAMPDDVRRAATTALDRLERGVWRPKHVLMHNDLWEGNILIDDANITDRAGRPWTERFVVIDWPGAVLKGYAIYDLIRLSRGMALSGRRLREEIEAHGRILGCDVEDAGSHLLAALGFLGTHLEHFPPEAYRRTTITCLGILGRIGRGGDGPGLTERMASTPPGVAATIAHGEPAVGRPE